MRRLGVLSAAVVIVAGCAIGAASPPPSATPMPVSPRPAAPSAVPSATAAAETWDLLWVTDSTGSNGVPAAYARRIEEDLGVSVRVHDGWTGNLSAAAVLHRLRGGEGGVLVSFGSGELNLPELVREAEVIVISGNHLGSVAPGQELEGCPSAPGQACPEAPSCESEAWAQYEADLIAIFDEVFRLREGRPVVLRTHDVYLPYGPALAWESCGQVDVCLACQRAASDAVHRAAAAKGVPVASYFHAFNGPNGDRPMPSTLISDGRHPSAAGAEALAAVVADLGYAVVTPTR